MMLRVAHHRKESGICVFDEAATLVTGTGLSLAPHRGRRQRGAANADPRPGQRRADRPSLWPNPAQAAT